MTGVDPVQGFGEINYCNSQFIELLRRDYIRTYFYSPFYPFPLSFINTK